MKAKGYIIISLLAVILLNFWSCGGKGANYNKLAVETCDCLKDAGLSNLSQSQAGILNFPMPNSREFERKAEDCLQRMARKMYDEIKDLSKEEKSEYVRGYFKAALDTECSDVIFEFIPYDLFISYWPRIKDELLEEAERR